MRVDLSRIFWKRIFLLFFAGIVLFRFSSVEAKPADGGMKVSDVIVLLELGYTEGDIIKEIKKRGMLGKFRLSPSDILRLRKAGASMKLLTAMRGRVRRRRMTPVTPAWIIKALKKGRSQSYIIGEIKRRGVKSELLHPPTTLKPRRAGASLRVLKAILRAQKLSKVKRKEGQGNFPEMKPVLPPVRAPLPINIENVDGGEKVGEDSEFIRPINRPRTSHERKMLKRRGVRVPLSRSRLYVHPGGYYRFRVPKRWRVLESAEDSGAFVTFFTPDKTDRIAYLKRGIGISITYFLKEDSRKLNRPLLAWARFIIQNNRLREPKLRLIGRPIKEKILDREAVTFSYQGVSRITVHVLRKKFYIFRLPRGFVSISIFAPPSEFPAFHLEVVAALQNLKFYNVAGEKRGRRLSRPMIVQELIRKMTPGVVSIAPVRTVKGREIAAPSGTGFIVTKDGYIVTNYHVAVDLRKRKPYKLYYINWDAGVGRKAVKARYVAGYFQQSRRSKAQMLDTATGRLSVRFQRQHVDIALLKIVEPGEYPTVPLSSISHSMLGDQVVAMGFPLEGSGVSEFGNESITATLGTISRLIRMADRRVNEIQHTAKIAGGNSGGPLFNTYTGAVVGINTWVGIFDPKKGRPAMGIGYYYAIPVDLVWQYFGDYLYPSSKNWRWTKWYELSNIWLADKRWEMAQRGFERVLKLNPRQIWAYLQIARVYQWRAGLYNDEKRERWLKKARRWADRGLRYDPENLDLMILLADVALSLEEWETADYLLRRAKKIDPYDWRIPLLKGAYYISRNKPRLALRESERAIKLLRDFLPDGYIFKAAILYRMKKYFEGQQLYRRALSIDPQNLSAALGDAMGYAYLKQFEDAEERFRELTKKYPYEPDVYRKMFLARVLGGKYRKAFKTFLKLYRVSNLRHLPVDANSLYLAFLIADKALPSKYVKSVKLGFAGSLLRYHSKSRVANRVRLQLIREFYRMGWGGLAYAMYRDMRRPFRDKKVEKLYKKLGTVVKRVGISESSFLFVALKTIPPWSASLLFKVFLITPTVLSKGAYRKLIKAGYPPQLIKLMIYINLKRLKSGVRPGSTAPPLRPSYSPPPRQPDSFRPSPPTYNRPGNRRAFLNKVKKQVDLTVKLFLLLVITGKTAKAWKVWDPHSGYDKFSLIYSGLRRLYRNGYRFRPFNPPKVTFFKHPSYKVIARYYLKFVSPNSRISTKYFDLRLHRGRWVIMAE